MEPARRRPVVMLAGSAAGTAGLLVAGRGAPAPVFLVLVFVSFAGFGALLFHETRAPSLATKSVLAVAAGLLVLAVALPPRGSRDVRAYVMYGRVASVHHANPYFHAPAEFPDDHDLARMQSQFRSIPTVYGPAFTGLSAVLTGLTRGSPVADRLAFQGVAAAAVFGSLLIMRRRGAGTLALAAVGLNPLVVVSIVSGGHNDAIVGLAMLAGVVLLDRSAAASGLALGLAVSVKLTALIPAVGVVTWLAVRDRRKGLVLASVAASVVVGTYAAVGGIAALAPLRSEGGYLSHFTLWHLIPQPAGAFLGDRTTIFGARLMSAVGSATALLAAIGVAIGFRRARSAAVPAVLATSAMIVTMPYVLPWYVGAIIPLAALEWRRRAVWLAPVYSALLFVWYPRLERPPWGEFVAELAEMGQTIVGLSALAALILLVAAAIRARRSRRPNAFGLRPILRDP